MTVASTTNRKSFSGDGVTTSFGTSPVVFYESTDLIVEVFSSTGTSTTLVENTNYTVSGGSATGAVGTVNLAGGPSPYGAPAVGTTLLIRRVLPLVQEADFLNNDINDAEVSETALDKLTMIAQQINETSGRGLNIPAVETATDALTVLPFDRASKYLAFDANKEMIASDGPAGDNVPVSSFMATVLDDTSAADARTTLGAAGSGAVTGSGLTMATSRLLGRTTASTGAIEEISVGAGLTLSGGSLVNAAPAAAVAAGDVLQVVTDTDAGSTTTSVSLVNVNVGNKTITPKNSASKILIEVTFQGSIGVVGGANATAYFQLYDVDGAALVGANYFLSAPSGAGGNGAQGPIVVRAIVSNSVTTARAFQLRARTDNASGAAGAQNMVWSFTEIKT